MRFRRTLLVCTVAFLLLSAGCLGSIAPGDGDDADTESSLDADELVEKAQSAESTVDSMQGTMEMTMDDGDETQSVTYEFWQRSSDAVRMEVVEADGVLGTPSLMVINGSVTWTYDEETNRAMKLDLGFSPSELTEFGEELNKAAFEGMAAERVGMDTVDDRSATIVKLTGNGSATFMPDEVTLWIDDETYYPLKQEMTMSSPSNVTTTMTMTFADVTFDAEISDERFTFEPPADAEVIESDGLGIETHEDADSAADAIPFDLPNPTIPDDYEFDVATTSETIAGYSASLQYTSDSNASLSVTVSDQTQDASFGVEAETITIGDIEATLVSTDLMNVSSTSISWTTDERRYSISGTADEETLRTVAESIVE